jgi:hypothetical protein
LVPLTNPEKPFDRTVSFWNDDNLEDDSFRRYSFSGSDDILDQEPPAFMHLTEGDNIHEFQVDNLCYQVNSSNETQAGRFNRLAMLQRYSGRLLF